MRELYGDDYESVAGDGATRFLPEGARRIAGAIVFLGLVGLMGTWAWRLGTRDAAEVPIVKAMGGPTRVAPEEPGGLQAAHQGLEVNGVLAGQPAPRAAPAVARAAPEVLAAEDTPQGELVVAAPAILAERVLAEAGDLPVPPADGQAADMQAAEQLSVEAAVDAVTAEDEEAAAQVAAAGPRPMNRPRDLVVARAKPAPAPAAEPAVAKVAAAKPPAPKPAVAKPAATPATHEVASAKAGSRMVQLGAYDSEEMTRRAWSRLVSANPDLLSSKSLYVERTTANARVFYRLRVAGFANTEQTRVMCESLRSRGIDCIPVTVQ